MIERLETMLAQGRDSALLRFGLGSEHLRAGDAAKAAAHLREALVHDPGYSAAWKLLGLALRDTDPEAARDAWRRGIATAQSKGDKQAAREMQVFLRRLERAVGSR
jgi:Tfp pilus assembly protein PilF